MILVVFIIGFVPFIKSEKVCPTIPPCYEARISLFNWIRYRDNFKPENSENHTYVNNDYNFQLTLNSAWKGYKVEVESLSSNLGDASLVFKVPTKSVNYGDGSGFATPFVVMIIQPAYWERIQSEDGPKPEYLGKSSNGLIYVYSTWQDPPTDFINNDLEINKVAASFTLTN